MTDSKRSPTSPHAYGYTRLADFMAWSPPRAVFQRFRSLNALNALGLQAELCRLEEEFRAQCVRDTKGVNPEKGYQIDWSILESDDVLARTQRERLLSVRDKLDKYNNALIQMITLNSQIGPTNSDLAQLKDWLSHIYHGASSLEGPGSDVYVTSSLDDLVSVWPPQKRPLDTLSRTMNRLLWSLTFRFLILIGSKRGSFPGRLPENAPPSVKYEGERDFVDYAPTVTLRRVTNAVATILCCLVITLPIIVLTYVTSKGWRLAIIVLSALLFSSSLVIVSDAPRKDVFAATAAFVAVQVVFVGSSGN